MRVSRRVETPRGPAGRPLWRRGMLEGFDEIIEAQKVRSELLKWKVLAVAALGATGLGLSEKESRPQADLVLCCIPFVCAYIDVLCRNLSLRIRVVSQFWRRGERPGRDSG